MEWILIFWIFKHGVATVTFPQKTECETAIVAMKKESVWGFSPQAVCVPRTITSKTGEN